MTVIPFPLRPSRTDWFKLGCEIVNPEHPIRCIDPVDELYALSELAEISAEKLKLAIDSNCDAQLENVWALLDRVQRLLKESRSHENGGVSP